MMSIRTVLAFLLCVLVVPAWAQDGDVASGKAKAGTCAACHGPDGNSLNPEWPKIAGQHAAYIESQLRAFKEGKLRSNAMMTGMVAPLSEEDMKDLGAYYASLSMSGGFASEALVKAGERLYRGGNAKTGVPACMSCHGPAGRGDPRAGFPHLAGQHAAYTQAQLEGFRLGSRSTDPRRMMRDIALKLTPDEMAAVASYISGLN
jgi:cytochrome c553